MPQLPPLTPKQRSAQASIAAHVRWSREDPAPSVARGQAALRARFDREARDAEPGLSDAEYARRAESAYRAHMTRLALASSRPAVPAGRHPPARPAPEPPSPLSAASH